VHFCVLLWPLQLHALTLPVDLLVPLASLPPTLHVVCVNPTDKHAFSPLKTTLHVAPVTPLSLHVFLD